MQVCYFVGWINEITTTTTNHFYQITYNHEKFWDQSVSMLQSNLNIDIPSSILFPEVGVSHSCLEWEGCSAGRTTQHACLHKKSNGNCRIWWGKFSHCQQKPKPRPRYFTFQSFFLYTQLSRVKSNQSICGVEPISFSLDDIMPQVDSMLERVQCLGPGVEGRPPAATTSDIRERFEGKRFFPISSQIRTFPKSLTRNYSQLVQNAYKACSDLHSFPTCLIFMKTDYKTCIYHLRCSPSFKWLKCLCLSRQTVSVVFLS